MKRFAETTIVAFAVAIAATAALGQEPVQQTGPQQSIQAGAARVQTRGQMRDANAWRYRWYAGRWWYWMPDNRWMVWTGDRWINPVTGSGQAATQSPLPVFGTRQRGAAPELGAPSAYQALRGRTGVYSGRGGTGTRF